MLCGRWLRGFGGAPLRDGAMVLCCSGRDRGGVRYGCRRVIQCEALLERVGRQNYQGSLIQSSANLLNVILLGVS